MITYTVGGLLAALKPAGMAFAWITNATTEKEGAGIMVNYDRRFRLHKTDFMNDLKKLDPETRCAPYYVTVHEYKSISGHIGCARNVYFGLRPGTRPNVIQDGDKEPEPC